LTAAPQLGNWDKQDEIEDEDEGEDEVEGPTTPHIIAVN